MLFWGGETEKKGASWSNLKIKSNFFLMDVAEAPETANHDWR